MVRKLNLKESLNLSNTAQVSNLFASVIPFYEYVTGLSKYSKEHFYDYESFENFLSEVNEVSRKLNDLYEELPYLQDYLKDELKY